MINASVHQEEIAIINTYAHSIRALKFIKPSFTDLKRNREQCSNSRGH